MAHAVQGPCAITMGAANRGSTRRVHPRFARADEYRSDLLIGGSTPGHDRSTGSSARGAEEVRRPCGGGCVERNPTCGSGGLPVVRAPVGTAAAARRSVCDGSPSSITSPSSERGTDAHGDHLGELSDVATTSVPGPRGAPVLDRSPPAVTGRALVAVARSRCRRSGDLSAVRSRRMRRTPGGRQE